MRLTGKLLKTVWRMIAPSAWFEIPAATQSGAHKVEGDVERRRLATLAPLVAALTMQVYGVVSEGLGEAIELFVDRREAEHVVENWDRDEPDRAGELYVEAIELETSAN